MRTIVHTVRNSLASMCTTLGLLAVSVALGSYAIAADVRRNTPWILHQANTSVTAAAATMRDHTVSTLVAAVPTVKVALTGHGRPTHLSAAEVKVAQNLITTLGRRSLPAHNPITTWLASVAYTLPRTLGHISGWATMAGALLLAIALTCSARRTRVLRRCAHYGVVAGVIGLAGLTVAPWAIHAVLGSTTNSQDLATLIAGYVSLLPLFVFMLITGGAGLVLLRRRNVAVQPT